MYYACYKIEHIGGQMKNVISMGGKEEKKKSNSRLMTRKVNSSEVDFLLHLCYI